jgi:hypothetical protein
MDINLSPEAEYEEIVNALHQCGPEDAVCCETESLFKKAKKLLIKEKLKDVTIQLLDSDGYAVRQVTSKPKAVNRDQLTGRQIAVVKALEKVLMHCKKEGVQLVGYSDELVALPAHIAAEDVASASAVDINCYDAYKGADSVLPETAL